MAVDSAESSYVMTVIYFLLVEYCDLYCLVSFFLFVLDYSLVLI